MEYEEQKLTNEEEGMVIGKQGDLERWDHEKGLRGIPHR